MQAAVQSVRRSRTKSKAMEKAQAKVAQKMKGEQKERIADKTKTLLKTDSSKEYTKAQDFKLHTQQRAAKRAVATKLYVDEQQRRIEKKVLKMIEEEEVRLLRKEMVPKAQLMPFFDRPFLPQRSNRPLTVPREPSRCSSGFQSFQSTKPIK
ncbi:hypothetical protein V2J09_012665 [Rumex salicifolius]